MPENAYQHYQIDVTHDAVGCYETRLDERKVKPSQLHNSMHSTKMCQLHLTQLKQRDLGEGGCLHWHHKSSCCWGLHALPNWKMADLYNLPGQGFEPVTFWLLA